MFIKETIFALVAAALPVIAWYFILRQKKHAKKLPHLFFTFVVAGGGAIIFHNFRPLLETYFGFDPQDFSTLFLLILAFGVVIEYYKNFVVRLTGIGYIKCIDDIIDLSFAAALGYNFFESYFYFFDMFAGNFPKMVGEPVNMTKYFLLREFFIPPIHLFCSGLFGYFYGIGIFATDGLREKEQQAFFYRIFSILLFFLPAKRRFRAIKVLQGTVISVSIFGFFFFLLELDPQLSHLLKVMNLPLLPVDEQLMPLIAFGFFEIGTVYFFILMDKKRRWENQKKLLTKP